MIAQPTPLVFYIVPSIKLDNEDREKLFFNIKMKVN